LKSLGLDLKQISVNLSPKQVSDPELVEFLRKELLNNNIDPSLIEIEITENVFLENSFDNIKVLEAIKNLGIKITLDEIIFHF